MANWLQRGMAKIGSSVGKASEYLGGMLDPTENEFRDIDPTGQYQREIDAASRFGRGGEEGFRDVGRRMLSTEGRLQRRATGQDSLSAEQLRQGLQQNIAAQRSMAASARPGGQAMAARTAAMQSGRLGAGLAGQQALAGIAERQAAESQLAQLQGQMRAQELQAALASRGAALQGYGGLEQLRAGRFGAVAGQPTGAERLMSLGQAGAQLYAMSDRRIKTDIADGDDDAKAFLDGLKAYRFKYQDGGKHGEGDQLGIMAQDLEATRLGKQAVVNTDEGKAVHGAKLATALAAATANINQRLKRLEA
jgi:hypothetical protein